MGKIIKFIFCLVYSLDNDIRVLVTLSSSTHDLCGFWLLPRTKIHGNLLEVLKALSYRFARIFMVEKMHTKFEIVCLLKHCNCITVNHYCLIVGNQ